MKYSTGINKVVNQRRAMGAPLPIGTQSAMNRGMSAFWLKRGIDSRRKYFGKLRGGNNTKI